MKIAIIGSGGVGGYFGGKLANAGFDVTFLARGAHLKALLKDGLIVKSVEGNFEVERVKATDQIVNIGIVDLILICVKAWQVSAIAKDIHLIMDAETTVMPLQNGVLALDELEEHISRKNLIGGLCKIISKIEAPGIIAHVGIKPTIIFGERSENTNDRLRLIKNIFDEAGIHSVPSENIEIELWKKFLFICSGGLLSITKSNYGELRELKETRQLFADLFNEIYQLALKMGINLSAEIPQKSLDFIDSLPYESTASMARDIWEGRPSEIEYQNGTVVKLAIKYGVDVPVNRFIYYSILPMEKRARESKNFYKPK